MSVSITSQDFTDFTPGGTLRIYCTLTTSGTYTTGGDAINFGANGLNIPSEYPPNDYHVFEQGATPSTVLSGYQYLYNIGSTQSNGQLQIFNGTAELGNGQSYPAATLKAVFSFPSL